MSVLFSQSVALDSIIHPCTNKCRRFQPTALSFWTVIFGEIEMSAKNADIPIAVLKVRRTFVRLCLENDDSHPNLKVLGDFDVSLHFVWFICFRVFIEQ